MTPVQMGIRDRIILVAYNGAGAVHATMDEDLYTNTIEAKTLSLIAVQAVYTGTPSGTLKLQGSIDGTNWSDVTGTATVIAAAGNTLWNLVDIAYPYLKLIYTFSASTGTLSVKYHAKQ